MATPPPTKPRGRRNQELADLLTPIAKGWCTDIGSEVASLGIQVHGGMGFIEETGVAQHYRDVRIAAIYEGTNGIQAIDLVGRKLPMRDGAVVRELIQRCANSTPTSRPPVSTIYGLRSPTPSSRRRSRRVATAEPRETGRRARGGDAVPAHGGTRRRRMVTRTQRAHRVATTRADTTDAETQAWLDAKIATARFFVTQLLPSAAALLPAVTSGADQLDSRAFT